VAYIENNAQEIVNCSMQPDVTVIIPAYNRSSVLFRALNSVKAQQGGKQIEIIVVDDGSTDGTYDLLTKHMPEVKVLRQPNRGPASARNLGLQIATGKYIAFLDSDDEWLESSLKYRVDFLERFSEIDMVFSDFEIYRGNTCVLESFLHSRKVWQNAKLIEKSPACFIVQNFFDCQLIQPVAQTSSVVIRKDAMGNEDIFDETLQVAEDWEFWLRFSARHNAGIVDRVLVRKYMQNDNLVEKRYLWFENNIRADRKILQTLKLSTEQKKYIVRRMGENFFEWAYYLINEKHSALKGIKLLAKSFVISPSWRCVRGLLKAMFVLCKYGVKSFGRI